MAGTNSAEGNTVFGNALLDAPVDPLVPAIIEQAQQVVGEMLDQNRIWAQQGISAALSTMEALRSAQFPSNLPDPPPVPGAVANFYSGTGLHFDEEPNLGTLTPFSIDDFHAEDIVIPNISSTIPAYVPVIAGLAIPDPPLYVAPPVPVAPVLDMTIEIPAPPVANYGTPPILDPITMPVYVAPIIPPFTAVPPTFTVTPPNPFIDWEEPEYTSAIADEVKAVLLSMLAGGTGIPVAVETAIWERERDREAIAARVSSVAAEQELSARGFAFPPGQLQFKLYAINDGSQRKLNEISRTIAIKQADLEQSNRQFAVTAGINFEKLFVDLFLAVVGRNFEIAKFQVETLIKIYELQIAQLNAEHLIFMAQVELYKVQLEAAFYYIKAFEALVAAEKAKVDMNVAKIQQYEAAIHAYNAEVEAYNSLIKAETAKAELEKNKVEVYKIEVDAMVGQIQGQKAIFEGYDSRIKGEVGKAQLEEANAQAYTAQVRAIGEQANIVVKEVDAEIAVQRLDLDWNLARMQKLITQGAQELQSIQARLASFQGINQKAITRYDAESRSRIAEFQAGVEQARVEVARFTALIAQWDAQSREIVAFAQINSESLRAAGQIASNLASGAMAGTHVSAAISGGANAGQSSSRAASDSTSRDQNYSESISYNYSGEIP